MPDKPSLEELHPRLFAHLRRSGLNVEETDRGTVLMYAIGGGSDVTRDEVRAMAKEFEREEELAKKKGVP